MFFKTPCEFSPGTPVSSHSKNIRVLIGDPKPASCVCLFSERPLSRRAAPLFFSVAAGLDTGTPHGPQRELAGVYRKWLDGLYVSVVMRDCFQLILMSHQYKSALEAHIGFLL